MKNKELEKEALFALEAKISRLYFGGVMGIIVGISFFFLPNIGSTNQNESIAFYAFLSFIFGIGALAWAIYLDRLKKEIKLKV